MNQKFKYALDQYKKDREKGAPGNFLTYLASLDNKGVTQEGGVVPPTTPNHSASSSGTVMPEAQPAGNNTSVVPDEPKTSSAVSPVLEGVPSGNGTIVVPGGTASGSSGTVTTGETDRLAQAKVDMTRPLSQVEIARNNMEQVRQKVYEVLNRKFQYNAKASPLYTILQQQYEKQAQKAAGEAFARASASTGGYGSSYAANVASEARRQTMEGFNDQQLALYQAAREEFLSERQSSLDWYNQAKLMYGDVQDEALAAAYDAAYSLWDGNNEETVRQALQDAGISAEQVNTIVSTLRKDKLDKFQTDYNIGEYEDAAAYKSAYRSAAALWTGDNESEVRTALLAAGVDAATVNEILRELKTGTLGDMTLDDELTAIRESREYKSAMSTASGIWNGSNEAEVRAALAGVDPSIVNTIVSELKKEYLSGMQTDSAITDIQQSNAYKSALELANSLKNSGKSIAEIQSELSGQYSATIVNRIVADLNAAEYEDKEMEYNNDVLDYNSEELKKTRAYNEALTKAYGMLGSMSMEEIAAALSRDTDAVVVGDVINALKQNKLTDMQYDQALKELEEKANGGEEKEIVASATEFLLTNFETFAENTMRAMLQSTNLYTPEQIDEAIETARETFKASVQDSAAAVSDISTAISYKSELDAARRSGVMSVQKYDEEIAKNSAFIMSSVNKYINDPDKIDYESLGISKTAWDGLDDSDKKLAVFDAIGQLAAEGVVTRSDYEKMLAKDTKEFFNSKDYKDSKTKPREAVDRAIIIKDLYDNGYLLKDQYTRLLYEEIAPKLEGTSIFGDMVEYAQKYYKKNNKSVTFKVMQAELQSSWNIVGYMKEWYNYTEEEKQMAFEMAVHIAQRPDKGKSSNDIRAEMSK